jgi:tetratricopeptide (TPR) repeat protein
MKDAHLTPEELGRLLEDSGEEIRNRIFLHHLAICPDCYAIGGFILDAYEDGQVGLDLCTIDIEFAQTRRQAPGLWQELRSRSPDERVTLVEEDERFRSWGLVELLCRASEEEAGRNPERAVGTAMLAVTIAMLLSDWSPTEDNWLRLLRGYAWAHVANAHRAAGDLRAAAQAFATAEHWWNPAFADTGDVLDFEAHFLSLKASLLRANRRLTESLRVLDEAAAARTTPELDIQILIKKAKSHEELGNIDEAIRLLGEAREKATGETLARLRLCLTQNFLDLLSKAGRFLEAECVLPEVRGVATESGNAIDRLRLRWTEARIAEGLGRKAEAIGLLEEARGGFVDLALPYDAALASLELALMHARVGRNEEVKRLALEALAFFDAQEIAREALGAVALFRNAVQSDQVTAELVVQVLACLGRARSGGRP